MAERVAIILAAGISSRMNPAPQRGGVNTQSFDGEPLRMVEPLPKVLHEVCGRPMLSFVLDACRQVGVTKIYAVVGYGAEQVKKRFGNADDIVWVYQEEQKGTAHAVLCCREHLQDFGGETLVLCGDGPLIRAETLEKLIETHSPARRTSGGPETAVTLATTILDDPTGYGRICRDADGNVRGIVEHSDCTSEQLEICEVNPSYYLFNNKILFESLQKVKPDNVKGEYYLTDVLSIIIAAGYKVVAVTAVRPEEAIGVNNKAQLDKVNNIMRQRIEDSKLKIQN